MNKIKEMGPQSLKKEAQQSGQEDKYQQLVDKLQEAASRGEKEARNVLSQMGESVESAGHKMKETGRQEEARH